MTDQLNLLKDQLFTMELTTQQRESLPVYSPQQTLYQQTRAQAQPLQAFLQRCQHREVELQAENTQLEQRILEAKTEIQKKEVEYKRDQEFLAKELQQTQEQCKAKNHEYKQTFKEYERDIEILEMERDKLNLDMSELGEKFTAADVVEMLRKLRQEIAD